MNWGWRIAFLYSGFVILIVTLVVLASRQTIDLEYKDYYSRELRFQDKINASENEASLKESITYELLDTELRIKAPSGLSPDSVKGELHFFRPSDANLDRTIPIHFDANGIQHLNRSVFHKGVYKLRISWTMNALPYYKEIVLNL
ncbi:MAG TPA: FixH family protein [Bacteroidia bacterium]|nr:FixH family protein [Bacteroidia bacterium]